LTKIIFDTKMYNLNKNWYTNIKNTDLDKSSIKCFSVINTFRSLYHTIKIFKNIDFKNFIGLTIKNFIVKHNYLAILNSDINVFNYFLNYSKIINKLKTTTINYDEHNVESLSFLQRKTQILNLLQKMKTRHKINFDKNV
jgi:hypothetical protein